MNRLEQRFQQTVAAYLDRVLPPGVFWTAVGHGGGGRVRGAILKSMGLRAGTPDLIFLYRGQFLGLELKSAKGRVSPAQDKCAHLIINSGGTWASARTLDDVERVLVAFGIPLRGRVLV